MEGRASGMFWNDNYPKSCRDDCTSQSHAFLDSSVHNLDAQNGTVDVCDWLNHLVENPTNPFVGHGVEAIESAMEVLNLSTNPYINTHSSRLRAAAVAAIARRIGDSFYDLYRLVIDQQPSQSQSQSQSQLEGLKGRVVSLGKDQYGCRFLQRKIDVGTPEEIRMILSELKDYLHELMKHEFGNHVIQKIFEANSTTVTVDQMDTIFLLIILDVQKLKDVCIHYLGSRAMLNILVNVKTPEKIYAFVLALKRITLTLMKTGNGGYVIQHCVKLFPPAYQKVILDEVAKNCIDIATDKYGSPIIQKCLGHVDQGQAIFLLVKEIIVNAAVLAEDQYGNYVVQFLIKMKIPSVDALIISRLRGKFVQLSTNMFGSHVVEVLLHFSEEEYAAIIIFEIMESREFFNVLQDRYGNFVAQSALEYSKGTLHQRLRNIILSNCKRLHSHLYGKNVLAVAKRCMIH